MSEDSGNVTMYRSATGTIANNIAKEFIPGGKRDEVVMSSSFAGCVKTRTRATISEQGGISSTGIETDLAIDGNGLFVVSDGIDGPTKYTRRGDFRQNKDGSWANGANQVAKAWKYDDSGNLSETALSLESLVNVNFASPKAPPVATTVVSLGMNLNAGEGALRGDGINAILNSRGKNAGKGADNIIFPERLSNATLELGDMFTFRSSDGSATKTVKFGGMVIAKAPGNTAFTKIYGSNSPNTAFKFNSPAAPSLLEIGHELRIEVAKQTYTFRAVDGNEDATNKTFNTINGLANAINKISALKAEVDSQGRLHIAPTKPNDSMIFSNGNGGGIKEALGLVDLAEETEVGITRFNSLTTLRDAINQGQADYSLKSTIEGKGVKITSLLSTSTLDLTSSSVGSHPILSTTYNPSGNELGRGTMFIESHSHTLIVGDLVNMTGQGTLPDGIYSVFDTNSNGFFVSLVQDDAQFPAAAAPVTTPLLPDAASWQKVGGETFATKLGRITASANGAGQQDIVVTTTTAHGYAVDDVVYIKGGQFYQGGNNITLPAGYYRVSAQTATTFTVGITASVAGAQALGYAGDGVEFRKVGTAAGGLPLAATGTFNTKVFSTNAALTNTVNYFIGNNHPYNIGDTITFTGLDNAGLVIGGITILNNVPYKVMTTDAGFVTFEVTGGSSGGPADSVYGTGAGLTPSTMRVNNGSQLMQYFSLNSNKLHFDKTYDPNDADKNLSAGINGAAHFSDSLTYSVPLEMYDSLGSPYTLVLSFAKLQSNEWAVELVAKKNQNGEFEVTNTTTSNGLIKSGIIKFDSDGKLQSTIGLEDSIPIVRNNGSSGGSITIDWANALSTIKSGSVTQSRSPNKIEINQNNGRAAGFLTKTEVAPNGDIVGTFNNGTVKKLYRIPMATFANVNGLVPGSNDTFEISSESGALILQEPGVGGTGKIVSGSLENSNVDVISELLKAQSFTDAARANMKIISMRNESLKTLFNEF